MLKKLFTFTLLVVALFCFGCASNKSAPTNSTATTFTDSIGRKITLTEPITKVVVANRYNMEVLSAIGAMDKVVGVDYGIYQDQEVYGQNFSREQVIGKGQGALNYEKIIELAPQILILTGNGSWEDAEKKLAPFGIQTVVLDAYYTDKFAETYTIAGKIFNKEKEAAAFIKYFEDKFAYINKALQNVPKKTVYFEYKRKGNTTVPGDYFFQMLEYAHAQNIFSTATSTEINIEAVVERNPQYIVKVGAVGVDPRHAPPSKDDFAARKTELVSRPAFDSIDAVKNDHILLLSQYAHGGAAKLVGAMYIAKFMYPEELPDLHPEAVFKEWVTKYQKMPYTAGHSSPQFTLTD